MKNTANDFFPDDFFIGGAKTFFCKGNNGRWMDILTEEELKNYELQIKEELDEKCAHWLQTGQILDTNN
ncbi:unnamed protein product [Adineta ricciae]|uniref:Sulfotransferase n=1 Tax=Adineta ricciae TaxID=249248 RepID=A0A815XEU1_ADIRI|nr:unnamed protein product [Adineta ricciae]CAF1687822.1 unnamed protein product [Adineta ricciae]